MLNIQVIIPAVVALVMIAVITIASGYPYLQAKLSFIFFGGIVLVLALVQLLRELRSAKRMTNAPKVEHEVLKRSASPALYGIESAWMVGFAFTIYLLGFTIALPLYICAYMKSHGAPWLASIMTRVFMSVFCYVIFVLILDMQLYQGEIMNRLGL